LGLLPGGHAGNAQAQGDDGGHFGIGVGDLALLQFRADALGHFQGAVEVRVGEDADELLAAVAGDEIGGAEQGAEEGVGDG